LIPFNKPYLTGKETDYIKEAVASGKISGNGTFTNNCHAFFEKRYGFKKCLLTSSCTDALEMAAILLNIQTGDEVIIPSYTFVSTANPFVLRGAKIVFADSMQSGPNINANGIEALITSKTKAIVVVHYAGVACDMDTVMEVAGRYNLFVVEDAAQAIDSYYTLKDGRQNPLGAFGHLAAFSFHETKNIISGEGGMLVINDERFNRRSEIIWEKGTNRAAFFRGEVNKYGWADIGSSFLPSEIVAAFLFAQLEHLDEIQAMRIKLWNLYYHLLKPLEEKGLIILPMVPGYATNNAHIFYILFAGINQRDDCIKYLKGHHVHPVFHYLSLHKSPYYANKHDGRELPFADYYSDSLLRLPMYYELSKENVFKICALIKQCCEINE
jgi:dTDP-4-amino-4,6-dideoxygalactose transaminase